MEGDGIELGFNDMAEDVLAFDRTLAARHVVEIMKDLMEGDEDGVVPKWAVEGLVSGALVG